MSVISVRRLTTINVILLVVALICQCFHPVSSNQNKRKGKRKQTEKVIISTSLDLTMKKASLKDFINFLSDLARGIIGSKVAELNGKSYGFNWSSNNQAGQAISMNLAITDHYATLIRLLAGPKRKFPVNSQVLKDSRHTQRPVLQTIIDFIEEQTNHHYSREIGQFMVKQAANFASLYFSSSAQIISSGLLTISSWLENKQE